jgi:hypothetical protein
MLDAKNRGAEAGGAGEGSGVKKANSLAAEVIVSLDTNH